MSILLAIIIWAVVIAILCWIVSLIPLPAAAGRFPLRNILYIVVALFALFLFLDIVGVVDLGIGWRGARVR